MSAAGEFRDELIATAKAIGAPGKGILAADESTGTIGKRFKAIDLENTEENRRNYRNLLFTAEGKYENHISGVILFEETLYQSTPEGKPFVEVLQERGVIPGIKVDKGVAELPGTDGETRTQGLDGLAARCQEYYKQGARFAKWRAVLKIGNGCPSDLSIHENAHGLAAYAAVCQANGLAPIVEPEILTDGEHTLEECAAATQRVQAVVTAALHQHNVLFEGMMLKPNMVLPGAQCATTYTPEQIAEATVGTLRKTLPAAVPCVCFLSGGQGEEEATVNLNAINSLPASDRPWSLTFSYGRALQASVIKTWEGKEENVAKAQEVFVARATANGLANLGQYTGDAATDLANASLYEKNYKY